MAVARLAAVVLAILTTTLVAQRPQLIPLTIKVTAGPVFSGILIEPVQISISPDKATATAEPNRQGEAFLELEPGKYVITVSSPNYKLWTKQIDLQNLSGRVVTVEMEIDCHARGVICDDVSVTTESGIPVERIPLTTQLPLQVLEVAVAIDTAHSFRSKHITKAHFRTLLHHCR
jgi:hypothetical protein